MIGFADEAEANKRATHMEEFSILDQFNINDSTMRPSSRDFSFLVNTLFSTFALWMGGCAIVERRCNIKESQSSSLKSLPNTMS